MSTTATESESKSTVASNCPGFAEGCPYKSLDEASVAIARKCPAFADGCPFKGAADVDTISQLLTEVPPSHLMSGHMMGSAKSLYDLLQQVHDISQTKKADVGGECPIFSTSCPFKNVTSHGSPLVSELEYRTWSVYSDEPPMPAVSVAADNNIDLSKHLKSGTKKSHRAAENVHFVRNFIKGKIDQRVYKKMVISLWHTYRALEEELTRHKDHPTYAKLHFPHELERVATLEEDLGYYYGPNWRELPEITAPPSPCTQDYVDRIRHIGNEAPEVLVAHAYTRYLGDLSGGQTLMRIAKKAMELPKDGSGTAFYRFENMKDSANAFKKKYRILMDQTPVDAEVRERKGCARAIVPLCCCAVVLLYWCTVVLVYCCTVALVFKAPYMCVVCAWCCICKCVPFTSLNILSPPPFPIPSFSPSFSPSMP